MKISQLFPLLLTLLILGSACDLLSSTGPFEFGDLPTPANIAESPPTITPLVVPTEAPIDIPPTATATLDPTLPDWTILVYMAADNSLDEAAIFNINQMEAASFDENIQVIVQLDRAAGKPWSDTRRYRIFPDNDPVNVTTEPLAEIGELNMGDPSVLADFIQWGLANYPAKRHSLVVWDHGVGWSGIAEDITDGDQLTLDELERALAAGIRQQDNFQFDMIGFDACLMGQLDVYQALVPYASAVAASEELTPAAGWPYTNWLNALAADTSSDGKMAAQLATSAFIDYYSTEAPSDFVTMAAIDLEKIGEVTDQLNQLTESLSQDLNLAASIIAPARAGTEIYAKAYGFDAEQYSAIDLNHFASILAEQSPDSMIAEQSQRVAEAVSNAVIQSKSGRGLPNASGISLYFPSSQDQVNPNYSIENALPAWESFLTNYHQTSLERNVPPKVNIFQETREVTDTLTIAAESNPLWLGFQISGLDLTTVNLLVGQPSAENRLKLLEIDPLIPEPSRLANGAKVYEWQDGLHEDFFIWHTRVTWLQDDSGNGQFVVLWPLAQDGSGNRRSARGVLISSATGEEFEASLVFDTTSRLSVQAWAFTEDSTPYEISARPGDTFIPYDWYLIDGQLTRERGALLTLNGGSQLSYEWRPVPDGIYQIGFEAENRSGTKGRTLIEVEVAQTAAIDRTYLDAYTGFQFDYPSDWYRPTWNGEQLFSTDQTGETAMQVSIFDESTGLSAEQIRQQALKDFGNIDILYEDQLEIAGLPATSTAYGYTDSDGLAHTGLFYTFVLGDNGYVVDLDGKQENEPGTIQIANTIANSWQFRPVGNGLFPGKWPRVNLKQISVPSPTNFEQRESGTWQRFQASWDSRVFIALKSDSIEVERAIDQTIQAMSNAASSNVNAFNETPTFRIAIRDRIWARRDFTYVDENGQEVWGFIMVAEESDGVSSYHITAWAEAPASSYNSIEQNVFAIMLSEIN
ncbi:MAG: clostripain-related cysteine peptidase [Chloroflexota bacterium]